MVPKSTASYLPICLPILASTSTVPVCLFRPRGQHMAWCYTSEHSDRQRGDTWSLFRFREPFKAALLIRLDVRLGISVVRYRGALFLPVSVHPPLSNGQPLLKGYVWNVREEAVEMILHYSELDSPEWCVVGALEVVVCGLRNGEVLCMPRLDVDSYDVTARVRSSQYDVLRPAAAMEMALNHPLPTTPVKWACLGWDGKWCGLYGWMLVHALVGDGSVGRVHIYSRLVEEHPSCASVKRGQYSLANVDDIIRATNWAGRLRPHT
jgi:hypothetical protein